jgi:DNA-directed RNA polymerase subunit K/omega
MESEYTKYEMAQMIGVRALQISQGAPFAIKFTPDELAKLNFNPIEIAKKEFAAGKIPLRVVRQ